MILALAPIRNEGYCLLVILSQISPYAIDMSFKIAVVDQLGENVLHKGWNRAGVKAKFIFVFGYQMLGKNHISDTQRGRDRFGKGVEIYYVIIR